MQLQDMVSYFPPGTLSFESPNTKVILLEEIYFTIERTILYVNI